jgi:predicted nucleic acid-binding protein
MAAARVIVDTGPLVGFIDTDDQWHGWARAQFAELPCPMLTSEAVLSEACYLLGHLSDRLLEMVQLNALEIEPLFPTQGARIRELMRRYAPRMQLADACIVRLSELHPTARVLSTDTADFRIYRRNRSEKLPLILP